MKTRILTQVVTAAAGLALPLSVFAQDIGTQQDLGHPEGGAVTSGPSDPSTGSSHSSGGTFSGNAARSSENKPGEFAGGIIVHNGVAYVVHRLQNEMALPDGSKVQPNGTVVESDGSTRSIGAGQALSIDGRVIGAPFGSDSNAMKSGAGSEGIYSSPNTPGSSTGIGESGGAPESPAGTPGSDIPPTTSTPTDGIGGSSSTLDPLDRGNNTDSDLEGQSRDSGESSGSIGTDPGQY